MKCPLRFNQENDDCILECAWRLYDENSSSACAIAAQAATVSGSLLLNYEKLVPADEAEVAE